MSGPCHYPHVSSNTRAHLVPLDDGPWLTAGPNRAGPCLILGGLALMVISLALASPVGFFMVLPAFAGLCISGIGLLSCVCIPLGRRWSQVCPECLRSMDRGATTCPHCQFHSPEEPHG